MADLLVVVIVAGEVADPVVNQVVPLSVVNSTSVNAPPGAVISHAITSWPEEGIMLVIVICPGTKVAADTAYVTSPADTKHVTTSNFMVEITDFDKRRMENIFWCMPLYCVQKSYVVQGFASTVQFTQKRSI